MSRIKIYTDEDIHGSVAPALIRHGIHATSTPQQENLSLSDKEQIQFATSIGAVLLTHNIQDFPRLHYEMIGSGESHCGIIVAKQRLSVGEIVRRVLRLASTFDDTDMIDRLEYLSRFD